MSYLLDTNVLSELRRPNKMDVRVKAWADSVALDEQYLSVVTLLEIETGLLLVSRRDPAQAAVLRRWLDEHVIPSFSGRILPIDLAVALRCARLQVPDPRPQFDALIAATALVNDLRVVTRNVADFEPMGVKLLNPWD